MQREREKECRNERNDENRMKCNEKQKDTATAKFKLGW